SRLDGAQVQTCDVGPGATPGGTHPTGGASEAASGRSAPLPRLPGGGPAFFIRKQGERIAGGSPLHPVFKTARWGSLHLLGWWPLERSLSGKSSPDQIWIRIFGENIFCWILLCKKSSHRK